MEPSEPFVREFDRFLENVTVRACLGKFKRRLLEQTATDYIKSERKRFMRAHFYVRVAAAPLTCGAAVATCAFAYFLLSIFDARIYICLSVSNFKPCVEVKIFLYFLLQSSLYFFGKVIKLFRIGNSSVLLY